MATRAVRRGDEPTVTYNLRYFNGSLDEFRIYNEALNADEVMLLYQSYEEASDKPDSSETAP